MTTTTQRPPGRKLQARVFRIVNVPMRALLSLPVPTPLSRRLMLLHHTGRVTGRHYRQPISYVPDGDTLLTPGGGRWTRNLRDGEPVRLRFRGRTVTATPELVSDPQQIDRLLTTMTERNPALKRFVRIPTRPDGHRDPEVLAAAADYGFRIVRWHLQAQPGETRHARTQ